MQKPSLRRLLSYLDDTLEPSKSRKIGQQLNEDPELRNLVERIKLVVRRRRLTAHSPDPDVAEVDANDVAEYLDRAIHREHKRDIEELILASDMSLAEAACVHQILSISPGRELELSDAARDRLYAIGGLGVARPAPAPARKTGPVPAARPIDPMLQESQTIPLGLHRLGDKGGWGRGLQAGLLLFLIGGLALAIYNTLAPNRPADIVVAPGANDSAPLPEGDKTPILEPGLPPVPPATSGKPVAGVVADASSKRASEKGAVNPPAPGKPSSEVPDKAEAKAAVTPPANNKMAVAKPTELAVRIPPEPLNAKTTEPTPIEPVTLERTPLERAVPPAPAGDAAPAEKNFRNDLVDDAVPLASFGSPEALLFKIAHGKIERMRPPVYVYADDRLVSPDGFRSRLVLKTRATLELGPDTTLIVESPGDRDFAWSMLGGQVMIETSERPLRVAVYFGKRQGPFSTPVVLEIAKDSQARIETRSAAPTGADRQQQAAKRLWTITLIRGSSDVTRTNQKQSLSAGSELLASGDGKLGMASPVRAPAPSLAETGNGERQKAAQHLAKLLEDIKLSVTVRLTEEVNDRNPEIRRLAVRWLAALGDYSSVVRALGNPDYADVRLTAISACRAALWRDPDASAQVRAALLENYSDSDAETVLELLYGYSADALSRPVTYQKMIGLLESDQLALRELAISNLRDITGRDLQYASVGSAKRRKTVATNWKNWLADQGTNLPPKKARP